MLRHVIVEVLGILDLIGVETEDQVTRFDPGDIRRTTRQGVQHVDTLETLSAYQLGIEVQGDTGARGLLALRNGRRGGRNFSGSWDFGGSRGFGRPGFSGGHRGRRRSGHCRHYRRYWGRNGWRGRTPR